MRVSLPSESNIEPFPTDRRKTLCPPARRFSRGAAIQQPVKRCCPAAGIATRKSPRRGLFGILSYQRFHRAGFLDGSTGGRLSPTLVPWGGNHPLCAGRNVSRETFTRSDPRQKSPRAGAFHSVADHIVDDINPAEQAVENGPAHRMPCGKADDHGQRAAEGNPFFDGLAHRLAHFLLPGPGLLRSLRRGSLVRLVHNVAPFRLRRITPAASF